MTRPQTIIKVADNFCGCGGATEGMKEASAEMDVTLDMVAINHWPVAVATHKANHPEVRQYCEDLETVNPRRVVPDGYLDIGIFAPECTGHSNAAGNKPKNDQSRATAWHVLRWAEALYIKHLLVENVKEFRDWGPLYPKGHAKEFLPIPERKGEFYRLWLRNLRALGYTVSERILNAADYGDATERHRLFIQARRKDAGGRIRWPEPTHVQSDALGLYPQAKRWRTAREIIDWSLPGTSIYTRKRPLVPNTMRRILRGVERFSGLPFIVGTGGPTGAGEPRSADRPLGTILGKDHRALCRPFLVVFRGNRDARSIDRPLPVQTADGGFGLCETFLLGQQSCSAPRTVDNPLPTIATAGAISVVEAALRPFLVVLRNNCDAASLDEPLNTLTTGGNFGLCELFVEYHGERAGQAPRTRSLDAPLSTVDTSNRLGLASCLINYHGNGGPLSLDAPLNTQDTRDRYALVSPDLVIDGVVDKGDVVGWMDIRFRMLEPHELAGAHSFPPSYCFAGNRGERVKQVGNSWGVGVGRALCKTILEGCR